MSIAMDQAVRDEVLDVKRSFIVQAPAGSGKTSLLVHRVLALLAIAERPEEVLAITFTRKAAAEMRERIIGALRSASAPEPKEDYQRRTWRLAKNALARDSEMGWNLLSYPLRLSIQTIDSLSASLVRKMPWATRTGGGSRISTNPGQLYRAAAQATLRHLPDARSPWREPVMKLLEQQDNDTGRVIGMLAAMLQKRDQWLRHVARDQLDMARADLESAWEDVIHHGLGRILNTVPRDCVTDILSTTVTAARNMASARVSSVLTACTGLTALPGTEPDDLAAWQGIRELFLVKGKAELRKRVDKRQGMPAGSAEKEMMLTLLPRLANHPAWIENLHNAAGLPSPRYDDSQWQGLLALVQCLKLAVAELQIQFRDAGEMDFSEVSLRAGQALGGVTSPTSLALRMDYYLSHVLVDEFQDTSHAHAALLENLIAGWEPDDGRTLFIVGDPMQSIYRFREADVGLFLRIRDRGVGFLRPEFKVLKCNFRSGEGLVGWYNSVFSEVLSRVDDMHRGAVSYSPAISSASTNRPGNVCLHALADPAQEADRVAKLVTCTLEEIDGLNEAAETRGDRDKVAILVRGRAHLDYILPALRHAGIDYQGVELESLSNRQTVLDILALVQAVIRLDHRPAWLAILRAPWCGLTLADLKALVGTAYDVPIWSRILDTKVNAAMSEEGRDRLGRIRTVLSEVMQSRHRVSITQNVEWAWRQLGGPDCMTGTSLDDVKNCFALLEKNERGGSLENLDEIEELLDQLYASVPAVDSARVQVMSIHRAKGLEFDTVILPGLGRQPGSDDKSALMWAEVAGDIPDKNRGTHEMLLAPLPETGSETTAQYDFLRDLERTRNQHEQARLLYVACTRAKRSLHLTAVLREDLGGEMKSPHARSLLHYLWPAIGEDFVQRYTPPDQGHPVTLKQSEPRLPAAILRLPAGYSAPQPDSIGWSVESAPSLPGERPEFSWAGDTARLVGIWLHDLLSSESGALLESFKENDFEQQCRDQLAILGIEQQDLDQAVERAWAGIRNMQGDERVRWIFSNEHQAARTELDLSYVVEGRIDRIRLDRTFIDEAGTRWIIDFKTGLHQGTDVEHFLDGEQDRYRPQLDRYAEVVSMLEDRPITLGLYFPMHAGWREWPYHRCQSRAC